MEKENLVKKIGECGLVALMATASIGGDVKADYTSRVGSLALGNALREVVNYNAQTEQGLREPYFLAKSGGGGFGASFGAGGCEFGAGGGGGGSDD